jgi:hypothetical protein
MVGTAGLLAAPSSVDLRVRLPSRTLLVREIGSAETLYVVVVTGPLVTMGLELLGPGITSRRGVAWTEWSLRTGEGG